MYRHHYSAVHDAAATQEHLEHPERFELSNLDYKTRIMPLNYRCKYKAAFSCFRLEVWCLNDCCFRLMVTVRRVELAVSRLKVS